MRRKGRQFALIDLDPVTQTSALDIVAHRLQQPWVSFIAANPGWSLAHTRLGPLPRLVKQPLPERRHVLQPATEPPALTLQVGCDIGRHQGGFDQKGTRATHGVGQGFPGCRAAWPVGAQQDCGSQVFLQWRGALLQTVATLMQAGAGQVHRQLHLTVTAVHIQAQIRLHPINARALAIRLAQLINQRILDLECAEMRVVDTRQATAEINRQRAVGGQVIGPVNRADTLIQGRRILCGETRQYQEHPIGQA